MKPLVLLSLGTGIDAANTQVECRKLHKYTHTYTNTSTQVQIYKCTNTAYDQVPERPNMWYIFEKRIVQGYQKLYSHVLNAQIQKYKFTNTQIHKYSI